MNATSMPHVPILWEATTVLATMAIRVADSTVQVVLNSKSPSLNSKVSCMTSYL